MGGAEQGYEVMVEENGVRGDVEAVQLALWMMGGEEALCQRVRSWRRAANCKFLLRAAVG